MGGEIINMEVIGSYQHQTTYFTTHQTKSCRSATFIKIIVLGRSLLSDAQGLFFPPLFCSFLRVVIDHCVRKCIGRYLFVTRQTSYLMSYLQPRIERVKYFAVMVYEFSGRGFGRKLNLWVGAHLFGLGIRIVKILRRIQAPSASVSSLFRYS